MLVDRTARLLLDANDEQERGVRFQIRPSPIRPALIVERPGGDRDPDHFAEEGEDESLADIPLGQAECHLVPAFQLFER